VLNANILIFDLQSSLNGFPVYQTVEYVLRHIRITSADAYDILRATNLNDLVKVLINFLKRETISTLYEYKIYIYCSIIKT